MKRCYNCNKKLDYLFFECKCKEIYCILCRLPEKHNCNVNYNKLGKEEIKNKNPKLTKEKINKI